MFYILFLAEWDRISQIHTPERIVKVGQGQTFEKGEHYVYTPLHGWATDVALNDPKMKSAFDFLDKKTFTEDIKLQDSAEEFKKCFYDILI